MRPHGTLSRSANGKPTNPAMGAVLTKNLLTFDDLIDLIEAQEADAEEAATRWFDRETGCHGERSSKKPTTSR
jgi:hypothetical protein